MTILEAMSDAGAFSGDSEWPGLNFKYLCAALVSRNGGIGISQFQQAYLSAGNPNGEVYVPNDANAVCFDWVNRLVWTKVDGLIGGDGWELPFLGSGPGEGYDVVPGDPLLFGIFQYQLIVEMVGSSAYLTWTYPASSAPDAALTSSLQMHLWLQRSYYKTDNPLAPAFWNLNVADGNEPVEQGWETIQTWNPGEDFPAVGTNPQYADTAPFPNSVHVANYRLVTKYFTGGTWNEVDWDIATALKKYVFDQAGSCATNPNQICLAWH